MSREEALRVIANAAGIERGVINVPVAIRQALQQTPRTESDRVLEAVGVLTGCFGPERIGPTRAMEPDWRAELARLVSTVDGATRGAVPAAAVRDAKALLGMEEQDTPGAFDAAADASAVQAALEANDDE